MRWFCDAWLVSYRPLARLLGRRVAANSYRGCLVRASAGGTGRQRLPGSMAAQDTNEQLRKAVEQAQQEVMETQVVVEVEE